MNWIATSVALALFVVSSTDAEAGWLRDEISGTALREGIKNYVGCVSAVQAESKALSQRLILEGVAEDIPLRMRTERSTLSADQKSELNVAYEMLKACRAGLTRIATKDIEMSRDLTRTFRNIDGIYASLLNGKLSTGTANTFLVRAADTAFSYIGLMPLQLEAPIFSCYTNWWSTTCEPM